MGCTHLLASIIRRRAYLESNIVASVVMEPTKPVSAPPFLVDEVVTKSSIVSRDMPAIIRVLGTVQQINYPTLILEHDGYKLKADLSAVDQKAVHLAGVGALLQIGGELERDPLLLRGSWIRLMAGLDVEEYKEVWKRMRQFQASRQ
eukprot:TRINITY_DN2174_c0_g1_i2.p1 TRINITY_DN2174_c0_g1~~TRINITY_DN2174_c0_g1_i2.p1  ORF type:complete len:147 (+),score=19.09 TRINITY_DN2174_c0_g1_i2:42-482(+)